MVYSKYYWTLDQNTKCCHFERRHSHLCLDPLLGHSQLLCAELLAGANLLLVPVGSSRVI